MRVSPDLTRIGGETRSSRALFVVPFAIILAVTLTDLTTPPSVHLSPFLIAAPAITASFAGAGGTAVVGALAVGAQVVIGASQGGLMTANHQAQIVALIVISGLVTSFRYATDRHRRRAESGALSGRGRAGGPAAAVARTNRGAEDRLAVSRGR